MNVLLVDDEAIIRKMMKLMLQSGGFQVFDASGGVDALALSQKHPIDVLVIDIVMEGMDGWALARSLTEGRPGLPVLFISGHPIDFETAPLQHPRCAFLPKPFRKNELVDAVTDLLAAV